LPLYEYQCGRCGRFEIIHKFSDAPLCVCPTCGGEVHKLPSAPAIQFKGTGWYITDYARKSGDGEKPAKPADGGTQEGAAAKESSSPPKDSSTPKESSGTSKDSSSKESSGTGKESSATCSNPPKSSVRERLPQTKTPGRPGDRSRG